MSRTILRLANGLYTLVVVLCLALVGLYATFALLDNRRIYSSAKDVQLKMEKIKPVVNEETGGASFEELLAINEDVKAWVTLDNTKIDHPVLQGATNLTYINTDVYGEFALSGSIYMDTRNSADYSDPYTLLYGHHMTNSGMFGDLDLYKDQTFFNENTTGKLILPDKIYHLETFAYLLVSAGEQHIFDPELWKADITGLLDFVREEHVFLHEDTLRKLEQMENPQILCFSTCSSEFTDARTIILAVMEPFQAAD